MAVSSTSLLSIFDTEEEILTIKSNERNEENEKWPQ